MQTDRRVIAAAIVLLLGALLFADVIGCMKVCKDIHDIRETYEPFLNKGFDIFLVVVTYQFGSKRQQR